MKRIYLATPVNARKEKTKEEKERAAFECIQDMKIYLRNWYPEAEFHSVFDFGFFDELIEKTEAEIMGFCTKTVIECDMIILDDGWENSKGCTVERFVAMQYGKQVRTFNSFLLKDKLNK